MTEQDRLRDALKSIAKLAEAASNGGAPEDDFSSDGYSGSEEDPNEIRICTPKTLPKRLLVEAAKTAVDVNPVNAPVFGPMAEVAQDMGPMDPLRIAVLTSKYWGPAPRTLSVSFMESTPVDLRRRIVSHMNAWSRTASIRFAETQGIGHVRISRGPTGYWSYLGTDILHIPQNRPTMNLQSFSMNTPEGEYRRVIRHETGHTMGFPHEHMRRQLVARIDREKAYEYFRRTQGWDRATVDQQVLTSLDDRSIFATPPDQTSIMCYQLPAEITRDGRPILGGVDINNTDFGFAGRIYPLRPHDLQSAAEEEWDEQYAT